MSSNSQPLKSVTDHMDVGDGANINILPGNMGMGMKMAQYANATAMMILAMVLFWCIAQVYTMHHEAVGILQQIINDSNRRTDTVIKDNTQALKELASEVRAWRGAPPKGG